MTKASENEDAKTAEPRTVFAPTLTPAEAQMLLDAINVHLGVTAHSVASGGVKSVPQATLIMTALSRLYSKIEGSRMYVADDVTKQAEDGDNA